MGRPMKYTVPERLDRLFSSKKAKEGDVIKRLRHQLLKYIPLEDLKNEVEKRDFHLAIVGEYVIITCFPGEIRFIT